MAGERNPGNWQVDAIGCGIIVMTEECVFFLEGEEAGGPGGIGFVCLNV